MAEFLIRHGPNGSWEPGLLLVGLFTTLRAGFWTLLLSLLLGSIFGAIGSSRSLAARIPCQMYVNLARNTPPLVILFCIYFFAGNIIPLNGAENALREAPAWFQEIFSHIFASPSQMDRMIAAVIALGLYQGAYATEIVRSGLESVPRGQWDAAFALGFGKIDTLRMVIAPQAVRLMLPPLTSQGINTFKETALVSLISLPDLIFQSLEIMAISSMTFEIWIAAAAIYLVICSCCAFIGGMIEKKYSFNT